MRNKKLWLLVGPLVGVHVLVLSAVFFAPYDPAEQHRDAPFAPPTRLHFVDSQGKLHFRPYVCSWADQTSSIGAPQYVEDCRHISRLRFFVRAHIDKSWGSPATGLRLVGSDGPAPMFLLGTDDYGRDQLSRLLTEARSRCSPDCSPQACHSAWGFLWAVLPDISVPGRTIHSCG